MSVCVCVLDSKAADRVTIVIGEALVERRQDEMKILGEVTDDIGVTRTDQLDKGRNESGSLLSGQSDHLQFDVQQLPHLSFK